MPFPDSLEHLRRYCRLLLSFSNNVLWAQLNGELSLQSCRHNEVSVFQVHVRLIVYMSLSLFSNGVTPPDFPVTRASGAQGHSSAGDSGGLP